MPSNKKIRRVSFTDQILNILLERILAGELKPGDRIKELQVANEMEDKPSAGTGGHSST